MELFKWQLYKFLLFIIGSKKEKLKITPPNKICTSNNGFYWVFCSTIGELNGCKPLIEKISKQGQLVLLTDRLCYQEAFHLHFPDAILIEINGSIAEAQQLTTKYPPNDFYVCEIPCTPNDAPCRLSYEFLRTVKSKEVNIVMVNGWLYQYPPSCRQDVIERKFFTKEYINLFDILLVQTEKIKQALVEKGANPKLLHVTGNLKFDALKDQAIHIKDDVSKTILTQLAKPNSKTIVAGCLSGEYEYQLLISSFKLVLKEFPAARLVIAPRHPEKKEQLSKIKDLLTEHALSHEFKSQLRDKLNDDTKVLVLDTFGELRSYYSIATAAYVGRNHNLLEPLTFGKPVVTLSGWESTYPSYPVYEITKQKGLIIEVDGDKAVSDALINALDLDLEKFNNTMLEQLASLDSCLELNGKLLNFLS